MLAHGCAEMPKHVNNLEPVIDSPKSTMVETDQGKYVRYVDDEFVIEAAAFSFGKIKYKYGPKYREVVLDNDAVILVDLKIVNKTDKKIEFKDYQVLLDDAYERGLYRWREEEINDIVSLSMGENMPADTALARRVTANLKENYFVVGVDLRPRETRRGFLAFTPLENKKIRYPIKLRVSVIYPSVFLQFDKKTDEKTEPGLFSY